MTTFTGGPAQGKTLYLRRTPIYLRVVADEMGGIDALDQPDDTPRPHESLYAYRVVKYGGSVHINSRDKQGRRNGGFYRIAEYALVDPQPPDETMRSGAAWVAWTEAAYAGEKQPKGAS